MERDVGRNTDNSLCAVKLCALGISSGNRVLVFEDRLGDVVNNLFGKIVVHNVGRHNGNRVYILIYALIGACGNCLTGVKAVLCREGVKLFVVDRNNRDIHAHGKVGDGGRGDTGNTEESVDLFVLQSVCGRTEAEVLLIDVFLDVDAVCGKDLLCVEFNAASRVTDGYTLAGKVGTDSIPLLLEATI